MKKESILYGVIGLLAGLLLAGVAATFAVNNDNHTMMRMMGMNTDHMSKQEVVSHNEMSMSEMTEQLKDRDGDDFDKAFIEMMISHHQGAIQMAELIPSRAKHSEIKQLGVAIIDAQTKEIEEMKRWQKEWGYHGTEVMDMMH